MLFLTHLLTHSLTHLLTYSLTYSLAHSLIHLLTYLLTHLLTHLLTYLLTHSLTYSLTYLLTYSLTYTGYGNQFELKSVSELLNRMKKDGEDGSSRGSRRTSYPAAAVTTFNGVDYVQPTDNNSRKMTSYMDVDAPKVLTHSLTSCPSSSAPTG